MGLTYDECRRNVIDTVNLLDSLGFTIHPDKSKLIPSQVLIFLGFVINSSHNEGMFRWRGGGGGGGI